MNRRFIWINAGMRKEAGCGRTFWEVHENGMGQAFVREENADGESTPGKSKDGSAEQL